MDWVEQTREEWARQVASSAPTEDSDDLAPPWEEEPEPDFFQRLYGNASGWLCLWTKGDKRSVWYHYPEHTVEALEAAQALAKRPSVGCPRPTISIWKA